MIATASDMSPNREYSSEAPSLLDRERLEKEHHIEAFQKRFALQATADIVDDPERQTKQELARQRFLEIVERGGDINANVRASVITTYDLTWLQQQEVVVGLENEGIITRWQGVYRSAELIAEDNKLEPLEVPVLDEDHQPILNAQGEPETTIVSVNTRKRERRIRNAYDRAEYALLAILAETQSLSPKKLVAATALEYPELEPRILEDSLMNALQDEDAKYVINTKGIIVEVDNVD